MGLARVGAGRVRGVVVCVRRPLLLVNEQGGGGRCHPCRRTGRFLASKNKVFWGTADVDLIVCGPGLFVTASGFKNNVRIGIPFEVIFEAVELRLFLSPSKDKLWKTNVRRRQTSAMASIRVPMRVSFGRRLWIHENDAKRKQNRHVNNDSDAL